MQPGWRPPLLPVAAGVSRLHTAPRAANSAKWWLWLYRFCRPRCLEGGRGRGSLPGYRVQRAGRGTLLACAPGRRRPFLLATSRIQMPPSSWPVSFLIPRTPPCCGCGLHHPAQSSSPRAAACMCMLSLPSDPGSHTAGAQVKSSRQQTIRLNSVRDIDYPAFSFSFPFPFPFPSPSPLFSRRTSAGPGNCEAIAAPDVRLVARCPAQCRHEPMETVMRTVRMGPGGLPMIMTGAAVLSGAGRVSFASPTLPYVVSCGGERTVPSISVQCELPSLGRHAPRASTLFMTCSPSLRPRPRPCYIPRSARINAPWRRCGQVATYPPWGTQVEVWSSTPPVPPEAAHRRIVKMPSAVISRFPLRPSPRRLAPDLASPITP
ncbi:hypothetical protein C8Q80DRAFT_605087 [Daedaleopsis nitida]|nr:hypothetical protein C8Q80DRAFT_605087 [Daedaleopsis nitida]